MICEIGYDTGEFGFDGNAVGVITALDRQSPDIARGVASSHDARIEGSTDPFDAAGAGDQGMMFGKDPSKVDRSASYAARHVAKNIVAAGLADRAEVQVAYAIGVARPLSLLIETFGTEKVARPLIADLVREHFDLRPAALVQALDLRRPIYRQTAAYGHFGRDEAGFTWERTDKAAALRAAAGLG